MHSTTQPPLAAENIQVQGAAMAQEPPAGHQAPATGCRPQATTGATFLRWSVPRASAAVLLPVLMQTQAHLVQLARLPPDKASVACRGGAACSCVRPCLTA